MRIQRVLCCLALVALMRHPGAAWAAAAEYVMAYPPQHPANATALHALNADDKRAPASLVKCMTAFLVYDAVANGTITLESPVAAPQEAAQTGGARLGLAQGQTMSVVDLLTAMLVVSANDAAVALAMHVGGTLDGFISAMNAKAVALGLENTRFATPNGLPASNQYSTAKDMALLAAALIAAHPQVLEITSRRGSWVGDRYLESYNDLLAFEGVDGLKTGSTRRAGACIVVSALRDGRRIILVLLGAKDAKAREKEAAALLRQYGGLTP